MKRRNFLKGTLASLAALPFARNLIKDDASIWNLDNCSQMCRSDEAHGIYFEHGSLKCSFGEKNIKVPTKLSHICFAQSMLQSNKPITWKGQNNGYANFERTNIDEDTFYYVLLGYGGC